MRHTTRANVRPTWQAVMTGGQERTPVAWLTMPALAAMFAAEWETEAISSASLSAGTDLVDARMHARHI